MEFDYIRPPNRVANKIISSFFLDYYLKNFTNKKKLDIIKQYRTHYFKDSETRDLIMEINFDQDEETIISFTTYAPNFLYLGHHRERVIRYYNFRDNKITLETNNDWVSISDTEYHFHQICENHIDKTQSGEKFTVVKNGYELLKVYNDTNPRYDIYINADILGIDNSYLGLYSYSSNSGNAIIHHKQLFNLVNNELKYIYDILNTKLPFKLDIPISIDGFNPNVSFIKNL